VEKVMEEEVAVEEAMELVREGTKAEAPEETDLVEYVGEVLVHFLERKAVPTEEVGSDLEVTALEVKAKEEEVAVVVATELVREGTRVEAPEETDLVEGVEEASVHFLERMAVPMAEVGSDLGGSELVEKVMEEEVVVEEAMELVREGTKVEAPEETDLVEGVEEASARSPERTAVPMGEVG